ncbi:MAG: tol-pal system protein YbgF [Alphaproteobacteria bacterium]|nr:tol-pal system protein YbgF [Alphaproteobacteria bacterium]
MKIHRIFLLIAATALAVPAFSPDTLAQSNVDARVERMERDLMILQRQFYRNQGGAGESSSEPSTVEVTGPGAAGLSVRLSQLEQQMRELTGLVEKSQFENQKLSEKLDKLSTDVDFRLRAVEGGAAAPATSAAMSATPETPVAPDAAAAVPATPRGETQALTGTPTAGSATEKYNQAFALLNQARYDEAALAFQEFTMSYPGDALVGNAYYWLGETYYVRRNYLASADNFRKGYEKAPEGPKAADNLLKLGMSLSAMDKKEEACVVLAQVTARFPKASVSVTQKVDAEKTRLGCK